MSKPLMPKATAVWLIDNTGLTFKQIADFCGLHELEIQALADGDINAGMTGSNPIAHNELTQEEIERCEKDPSAELKMSASDLPQPKKRSKGPKYTPVSKRGDKPDAIAYLLRNHALLADSQIVKLVGTTKNTINAVRDRTHANIQNIAPKDPVILGLCSQTELNAAVEKAERKADRAAKAAAKEKAKAAASEETAAAVDENDPFAAVTAAADMMDTSSDAAEAPAEPAAEAEAAPAEEVTEEVAADETSAEETPAEDTGAEEAPVEETPVDEAKKEAAS